MCGLHRGVATPKVAFTSNAPRMSRAPNFSLLLPGNAPFGAPRRLRQHHRNNDCQRQQKQRDFLIRGQSAALSWLPDRRGGAARV